MTTAAAKAVLTMFTRNWGVLKGRYDHIAPFTLAEIKASLKGERGKMISERYSRFHQFSQVMSAIGSRVIDKEAGTAHDKAVYISVWGLEISLKCPVCQRAYSATLLMQSPTCSRARCNLVHMRNNI